MPEMACDCGADDLGDVHIASQSVTVDAGTSGVQFLSFCNPGDKNETSVRVVLPGPPASNDKDAPKSKTYLAAEVAKATKDAINATAGFSATTLSGTTDSIVVKEVCKVDDSLPNLHVSRVTGEGGDALPKVIPWTQCWWRFTFVRKVKKRLDPDQAGSVHDEPRKGIISPLAGAQHVTFGPGTGIDLEILDWPSAPLDTVILLHLAAMGGYDTPTWADVATVRLTPAASVRGGPIGTILSTLRLSGWQVQSVGGTTVRVLGKVGEPIVSFSWTFSAYGPLQGGIHLEVRSARRVEDSNHISDSRGRLGHTVVAGPVLPSEPSQRATLTADLAQEPD